VGFLEGRFRFVEAGLVAASQRFGLIDGDAISALVSAESVRLWALLRRLVEVSCL